MGNRSSTEEDELGAGEGEGGQQRSLYHFELSREQWPIVYSPEYNIGFLGMERLHPFDSSKWAKVFQFLVGESSWPLDLYWPGVLPLPCSASVDIYKLLLKMYTVHHGSETELCEYTILHVALVSFSFFFALTLVVTL